VVLLNVAVFAIAGFLGLSFLLQTLHRISVAEEQERIDSLERPPIQPPPLPDATPAPGALEKMEGHVLRAHVKGVFRIWVVVFGLVGAQMGWILRPFVGDPHLPFRLFRPRVSNFFLDVIDKIKHLF
jgi:hypothetical protein